MQGRLYLDEALVPKRSLSRGAYVRLAAALLAVNAVMAVFLLVIGATPAPFFLGLDVLGVLLAFRASYRPPRRFERVTVGSDAVEVVRHGGPGGEAVVWRSAPAFTRVCVDEDARLGPLVSVRQSARGLIIARALGEPERRRLARALEAAIAAARAERHDAAGAPGPSEDVAREVLVGGEGGDPVAHIGPVDDHGLA